MTRSATEIANLMEQELRELKEEQKLMREELREMKESLLAITSTLSDVMKFLKMKSEANGASSEKKERVESKGVVQLRTFDGTDPIGWLARANLQFEISETAPEMKVSAAMVAMEGAALYWSSWLRKRRPTLSWEGLSEALVARFDTRFQGDAYERLAGIEQTGSVDDYINLFVQLASQVPGLTDAHYLGYFMKGLRDQVRGFLRLFRCTDLEAAMELARDVEAYFVGNTCSGVWRKY